MNAWRIILGARKILTMGLDVGDGHQIKIWKDIWVPKFRIVTPRHLFSKDSLLMRIL